MSTPPALVEWRHRNKERVAEISRKSYLKNKDKINAAARQWKRDNPEKFKSIKLKYDYGITLEEYTKILLDQNSSCAICGRHQSEFKLALAVDHCHTTGKIRGLLCGPCNTGLGHYEKKHVQYKQYLEGVR